MRQKTRILGIDPGLVTTGVGLIETDGIDNTYLHHRAIRVGKGCIPARLNTIFAEITQYILEWQPNEVAIEEVFISNNPMSALKLGQARGAAICASVQQDLPVSEYSARQVKQCIVGTGAAHKQQIQHMVKSLLTIDIDNLQLDAADALGIALCHSHSRKLRLPMQLRGNRRRRGTRLRL